ncbi:uncharacterized protein LACBIDRAFT_334217 [Laccaria bicolor S238N-H82]|uniref:Predicted protein n=1 Tax=Laccaria bicolor (strain S238N-H82 / ATCC MYA-4686) TaxID=486041 RepID=B0DYH7_LACBS|nr:uncharacterized protein LACBIDRAFT_334217 [Laccaria bicolor S238N-H82]EDR00388.1 predicted protein [Laccaria bicolor S238N-H82]|eukprot:XP_001888947.1 predicted protein [Laccaria bicolor S238N-H82]
MYSTYMELHTKYTYFVRVCNKKGTDGVTEGWTLGTWGSPKKAQEPESGSGSEAPRFRLEGAKRELGEEWANGARMGSRLLKVARIVLETKKGVEVRASDWDTWSDCMCGLTSRPLPREPLDIGQHVAHVSAQDCQQPNAMNLINHRDGVPGARECFTGHDGRWSRCIMVTWSRKDTKRMKEEFELSSVTVNKTSKFTRAVQHSGGEGVRIAQVGTQGGKDSDSRRCWVDSLDPGSLVLEHVGTSNLLSPQRGRVAVGAKCKTDNELGLLPVSFLWWWWKVEMSWTYKQTDPKAHQQPLATSQDPCSSPHNHTPGYTAVRERDTLNVGLAKAEETPETGAQAHGRKVPL